MRKSVIYFLMLILIFVFTITAYIDDVRSHEKIHQVIFENYGIESNVKYNWNIFSGKDWVGMTIPINSSSNCTELCVLAQEQNEIVGYYSTIIVSLIFAIIIIYYITQMCLELHNEHKEEEKNELENFY
jgi:hypothetical protein